jgi:hypothetical protein
LIEAVRVATTEMPMVANDLESDPKSNGPPALAPTLIAHADEIIE